MIQMYDPTRDYKNHKEEYDEAIRNVLGHGLFINGPEVKELEKQLAKYTGSTYCISVSNGTDALRIALLALGVGHGDEVITVAHSWISTAEVIPLVGAIPVFVDIEDVTYNMDSTKLEEKITEKTKAIIIVNIYGQIGQVREVMEIAKRHNVKVIEDGAQSFGATINGKQSGTFADVGTTSFFPSKPLGCYGDGGACFTDNEELGSLMRAIKNNGSFKRFHHFCIGTNARLDTLQAAILQIKLKYFDKCLEKRNYVANYYNYKLKDLDIVLPKIIEGRYSVWAQYTIRVKNKDIRYKLFEYLKNNNINAAIFYPAALHLQECFNKYNFKVGDLPVTEQICDTVINLPCYAELTEEELEYICSTFRKGLAYVNLL